MVKEEEETWGNKTPTKKGSTEERINAIGPCAYVKALYFACLATNDLRGQQVIDPMHVIRSIRDRWAKLPVRYPPTQIPESGQNW